MKISIKKTGNETTVMLDGKDISGSLNGVSIEIKPLEPIKVFLNVIPDELELIGDTSAIEKTCCICREDIDCNLRKVVIK